MNRRMRRERDRAKFEGARQRALARLGEQWRQLQERLRSEDVLEPLPPSIRRTVNGFAGTGRVLVVGPGGATTDLGIKGISFALGHRPMEEYDAAREGQFVDAGMATGGPPLVSTERCTCRQRVRTMRSMTGETWEVLGPVETCDACLDAAPLAQPRPPHRDPWPCVMCTTEGWRDRRPDGSTRLVPTGRTITCPSCRAAGAPEYLP